MRNKSLTGRKVFIGMIFFILGAILLGGGISNVVHAGEIASNGVRVNAVVLGSAGGFADRYGVPHGLQVGYTTASGQQEQGTLDAPNAASSYRVGSAMTVVYDPFDPSVVTMPKESSSSPWSQVVAGIAALICAAAWLVWTLKTARKRRPQAAVSRNAPDKA